jgi:hypothetical protein
VTAQTYFIQAPNGDIKIGKSVDVLKRIKGLQGSLSRRNKELLSLAVDLRNDHELIDNYGHYEY